MKIAKSVTELIGATPLLQLDNLSKAENLKGIVIAKLEYFNPAGSVKDRVALSMIEDAEKSGKLKPGATLIEPTSGNTGVGLAFIAAARGYKLILTMPETMSIERRKLVAAYGATVELTPGSKGMKGAIEKAEELHQNIPGSVILGQFVNPANPAVHYRTTAEEILRDTDGNVDILVGGVGTGGTISGTGKRLKEVLKDVKVVAVEPATSAVLSGEPAGKHGIQGIGAGFIPETYNESVVDEIITVSTEEAYEYARKMAATEGVLVGISSGAALAVAVKLAKKNENANKNIVVVLPDTGERYLSTDLFTVGQ
ncbi:MAG: cysteine synthase A [Muribaculaceae bacterium]|nr:cysteine synthase A [Muribaculaceae bacterium]